MAPLRHRQALAALLALPEQCVPSLLGGQNVTRRRFLPPALSAAQSLWACGLRGGCWCPRLSLSLACALLPQSAGRAFDLERLHGEDVHGRFQLPPRPGV